MTLTDRFVSGVRAATRETYFDTKVLGLALRVSATGTRTWSFVYRTRGKPSQWLKLGSFPALSLVDARKLALDQRKAIDVDGRDPVAERQAARREKDDPGPPLFTFNDLGKLYLTFAKSTKKDWNNERQKIAKYLVPAWGPLPVRDITRTHVHELLDTLVANGMTTGVNRVQAVISRMFTVALDRSLIDAHPAARMIKRVAERPRERVLSDDEIRQLWAGLDAHPRAAADAVRLRLLLGQRGAEVNAMHWNAVDLDAATWEMPGSMTKNSRPHIVALPPTALDVLTRRRATVPDNEPRIFPGLTMASQGYRGLAVIHDGQFEWKDTRRTMATRLAALGFSETTIGRVLNHARYTVTSRHYNQHRYLSETRAALVAWDNEIHRILKKHVPKEKVLPFATA